MYFSCHLFVNHKFTNYSNLNCIRNMETGCVMTKKIKSGKVVIEGTFEFLIYVYCCNTCKKWKRNYNHNYVKDN